MIPNSGGLLGDSRHRAIAYVMAFALLIVLGATFTVTSWQRAVEQHDRALETMVVMGAQAVDTYFSTLEKSLAGLENGLRRNGFGADSWRVLAAYRQRFPEFGIVVLNRPDGSNISTSEGPGSGVKLDFSADPSFIAAREALRNGERMVVSRAIFGPVSHKLVTPLRYGIRDKAGNLQYILGAGLSQERTHAFWRDAPLPPGAGMGLMREDFYVVARHPVPENISGNIFAEPFRGLLPDYLTAKGFPASGVVRGKSIITDDNTTIIFRRLADFPLTFYVNNPERNLRRDWWASAWPTYLLMLLLFGGGVGITHWIGVRQSVWQREREERVAELEGLAQRLQVSNTELERAKGELEAFMYTVSHDLRSPIRSIDGFSAMLQDRLADAGDKDAIALLARVRANANRMGELLKNLLELCSYSMQEMKREQINMTGEVASVVEELGGELGIAKIETGVLPPCRGDRLLIHQVWRNLVSNALKYSAKAAQPVVRIGFENGEYFVADNGAGFDAAAGDRLFKLFSRLHSEREFSGTGVGLAIVKRVIERHGGRIRANGAVGVGAQFSFTIAS